MAGLLSQPASDIGTLTYRQQVFGDLEDRELFEAARTFANRMEIDVQVADLPVSVEFVHRQ